MKEIKRIVELVVDFEGFDTEGFGVDVVSIVDRPAIQVGFQAFSQEEFVEPNKGETQDEYMGRCVGYMVNEGYESSQAAAICYSKWDAKKFAAIGKVSLDFDGTANTANGADLVKILLEEGNDVYIISARNDDTEIRKWATAHGIPSSNVFATGSNKAKIEKIKELGIKVHYDNNPDVIAQIKSVGVQFKSHECSHQELNEEQQGLVLQLAEQLGQEIGTDWVHLDLTQKEFATLGDYLKGLAGLNILSGNSHTVETKYQYSGPMAERAFCKAMLRMNKVYTRDEIDQMSSAINTGFRHDGQTYSIFEFKGGVYCHHFWSEIQVITSPDGGVVTINKGPVNGDAGVATNDMPSRGRYGMQRVELSVQDEEQRIVTGPALIPNQFIIRKDENGDPYYVYFTQKTIKDVAERFFARNNQNNTDINHDHNIMDSNTLLESWIISNPKFDKSTELGYNLPTGTWMCSYKINDEETWNRIKSGELRGFSVAGNFIEKHTKQ
jgi:hypothetical protein